MIKPICDRYFLVKCLSCYHDDISSSIYFNGAYGTIFSSIKSVLFFSLKSSNEVKNERLCICKTPAQLKSTQKFIPEVKILDLHNLRFLTLLVRGNKLWLFLFLINIFQVLFLVRKSGVIKKAGNKRLRTELSFASEIAAARVIAEKSAIFRVKRAEIILCSDHNAFFIALCLYCDNLRFSFLPHAVNIGGDNHARRKDIFDKIYCYSLIQYFSFKGWEPNANFSLLKSEKKLWTVGDAKRLKSHVGVVVIWLNQLDFFEHRLNITQKFIEDLLVQYQSKIKSLVIVSKTGDAKILRWCNQALFDDPEIINFSSMAEFKDYFGDTIPNYVHAVLTSGVSADLFMEGVDMKLHVENPLITDTKLKEMIKNFYRYRLVGSTNTVCLERISE